LSASPDSHVAAADCLNCGAPLSGHYCASCGQEAILHMPSAGEFLHEFVGHYVALESKLAGTLARLLFRPGMLTNEYVAGRRVRYLQPLRLYLSLSILFFAIIKFNSPHMIGPDNDAAVHIGAGKGSVASEAAAKAAAAREAAAKAAVKEAVKDTPAESAPAAAEEKDDDWPGEVEHVAPWLGAKLRHFNSLPKEKQNEELYENFFHYVPYAVFGMMPLFALYLKILYLGSGRRYGEHLLFALHSNSFAFIMLTVFALSPWKLVRAVALLWMLVYLPLAMRRVYKRSRRGTMWRWLLLMIAYPLTLLLAIMLTFAMPVLR
jgi:hypothetical protein